jgi:elongation factor P
MASLSVTALKRGMAIVNKGDVCVVVENKHHTPPNMAASVMTTVRSIASGKLTYLRFSTGDKAETIPLFTRKMEFSYMEGEDWVFVDPQNYEMVTVMPDIVAEAKNFIIPNAEVAITFVEERAVMLEVPASVILEVTDAPEGVRGDSANNVQKPITLETGITIQAPLFIKTGEKIKVDTRTSKYMERA